MTTPAKDRDAGAPRETRETRVGGGYASYVLALLVVVYVFNFIDRQILSILADDITRDLGLTDAEIALLYGTTFAVFYAVFGIPLGRVADTWDRRRLIAIGLAFWSAMTAASGLARNLLQLAAARVGVGVGEASASPAAFSMLSDYFPPHLRTTAIAIYSSGIYIGAGLGIFIGGWIVEGWRGLYPDPAAVPFGLRGWQVAFMAVGAPGLLLAAWVRTLREPVRGASDGRLAPPPTGRPARVFWEELRGMVPVVSARLAPVEARAPATRANLVAGAAIAVCAAALIAWLGDEIQWIALGVGLYFAFCWAYGLARRDPPTFGLIFRSRAQILAALGFAALGFGGYGIGFFTPLFFQRIHGQSAGVVGTWVGLAAAAGGWLGVTLGGVTADLLRRRTRNGRIWVGASAAVGVVPFAIWMLTTTNTSLAFALNFAVSVLASAWIGPAASTVQDLVLPRMRAVASATYILVVTFIGLALGPYTIGRVSDGLGDLRAAMLLALIAYGVAAVLLLAASRHMPRAEETLADRARAAGEEID